MDEITDIKFRIYQTTVHSCRFLHTIYRGDEFETKHRIYRIWNMRQAMADGMLASGIVKGEQLYACARQWDKLCRNTEVRGMHACKHAIDMVTAV